MVTPKVGYERFINILAVILPFLVAEIIVCMYSIFETKMVVTKPTSVALFCCFFVIYFFRKFHSPWQYLIHTKHELTMYEWWT